MSSSTADDRQQPKRVPSNASASRPNRHHRTATVPIGESATETSCSSDSEMDRRRQQKQVGGVADGDSSGARAGGLYVRRVGRSESASNNDDRPNRVCLVLVFITIVVCRESKGVTMGSSTFRSYRRSLIHLCNRT